MKVYDQAFKELNEYIVELPWLTSTRRSAITLPNGSRRGDDNYVSFYI